MHSALGWNVHACNTSLPAAMAAPWQHLLSRPRRDRLATTAAMRQPPGSLLPGMRALVTAPCLRARLLPGRHPATYPSSRPSSYTYTQPQRLPHCCRAPPSGWSSTLQQQLLPAPLPLPLARALALALLGRALALRLVRRQQLHAAALDRRETRSVWAGAGGRRSSGGARWSSYAGKACPGRSSFTALTVSPCRRRASAASPRCPRSCTSP